MPNQTKVIRNPKKPIRVYFNRCFSTTPKIIQRLLSFSDIHRFKIYISHGCVNNYLQEVADYFEVEPSLDGKNYVDYCLNFCLKHEIELFVPRYNVTTLINYKEEFDRIGVKVMFIGSSEIYQLLESKIKTYEVLSNIDIVAIPKTFCVKNYEDFQIAYTKIIEIGSSACMKPISGIGGNGFKKIIETMTEIDELYQSTGSTISKDRIARILKDSQNVEPFIVMEYLEGDEFSIDCLANKGELIRAIPRRKLDFYRQNIEHREDLIAIAQKLTKKFNLNYLYNIQLKYHKGKVYLIEINTRMSGGIHKSSLAGVNFLYLAIKLLMGEAVTNREAIRWDFQIRTIENYELTDLG
ncbi:ATP-grasp domain-containing protein [Desulfosporosinus sp. Sb-LF]|uniref:ATP-grasp domain-containing protein n=1 Tax=Desulfosporosinus sp. Sb-LF TaxID=2560027 RepID=UPI00107FB062|nr:ATP-grasp domain-containing protein [Desulfosporosinus sp. Sb-LF]TGE31680.1 ATP-grasp domain-containing protein [Desulfosporosinus sp. Sb-LF]